MKMEYRFMSLIALAVYQQATSLSNNPDPVKSLKTIEESSNHVSISVYKILSKAKGNLLICPISFNIVMALLTLGTSGKTSLEMKNSLHLSVNNHDIEVGYKMLLAKLKDERLKIATGIFSQKGLTIDPKFMETAHKYFDSDIQSLDFENSPIEAMKIVNMFIEENTNNKIHDILDEKLASSTRFLLANAAHFMDSWKYKFDIDDVGKFYLSENKSVDTEMMKKYESGLRFLYTTDDILDAKILQLYFKNPAFSMIIILPNKIDGLRNVENKLTRNKQSVFHEIMKRLQWAKVYIKIPKFKIEQQIQMKEIFKQLGIKKLFTPDAEVSGFPNNELNDLLIIHKTYIEVNNKGVEAAAATAIISFLKSESYDELPVKFIADHPFMFTIMHETTILFQGRFVNP